MKWRTPEPRPYYAKYKRIAVENDCGGWFVCYELPGDVVAICEPQHLQDEKYGYYGDPKTMKQYFFDGFSIVYKE